MEDMDVWTLQVYQLSNHISISSVNENKDICLVKDDKMKEKDKRRQIAFMSKRNMSRYIVAIEHSNFMIVPEKGPTKRFGKRCPQVNFIISNLF